MRGRRSDRAPMAALDPALVRMARLEGLSASSYRLAPNIVTLTITATALQLGTGVDVVRGAVALATLAAVAAITWELWRMRRGARAAVRPLTVLASFLTMAVALGLVAASRNAAMLAGGMALMGIPLAVNVRFRHAAMARFRGLEGSFQAVAHQWNRIGRVGLLLVVGTVASVPMLGWRWAAAVAALWFALLGIAVHLLGRFRTGAAPSGDEHHEARLTRQWRLGSVKRHAGTMLLASAVMQMALATVEPALRAAHVGAPTLVAAVALTVVQIGLAGVVRRIARGSDQSARQMALRATWWFPLAAPAALVAVGASGPVVALVGVLAWMAVVEVGFGGASAATRVGLGRVGQLASLLGALAGYVGTTLGSLLPSIGVLAGGWGLAASLLVGAVLSVVVARWTPRHATDVEAETTDAEVTLELVPHGQRAVGVHLNGSRTYELYGSDLLQARVRFDARRLSEPIELVRLVTWVGAPGPLWRLLARLRGRIERAGGLWPLDVVPFAAAGFAGYVRWTGPGSCALRVAKSGQGCSIALHLPADEAGRSVHWRLLGGLSQDDPAPEL